MHFFKNFDWSLKSILKLIGAVLVGVVAITLIILLLGLARNNLSRLGMRDETSVTQGKMAPNYGYDQDSYGEGGLAAPDSAPIMPPIPESPAGADLEAFEVRSYTANVQTRHLERDCQEIADLKAQDEVIFENSDQNEDSCYFYFKVKKENSDEIVALIDSMDPDYFNVNLQTIKESVDNYSQELDILTKNLEEIQAALQSALESYDQVTTLATNQGDAETLANVLNNKLTLIQQLTDKRLELENTIQRYEQNKADQLDRLDYNFFNVSLYKDVIFDWQDIQENWKFQAKELVRYLNMALQGVTVLLVGYAFIALQCVIYFVLLTFVLKGLWIFTKRVWGIGGRKK